METPLLRRGLKMTHLRLMAALAEAGHLGTAAGQLGITQPAASRLLAELEHVAGAPVHRRTGRGLSLTEAGEALARRAARILSDLADADREIAGIAAGAGGHVRLGSVTGPALDRVLPALRTLRLAAPGITAEVEVGPSNLLAGMLLAGRLDFALARTPADLDPALFDTVPMGDEEVSLLVRAGHRLKGFRPAPDDLLTHDWILPGPGAILRTAVLGRLAALGLPPPGGQLSTSSILLTLAMLRETNAIAPLATAVARRFAADGGYAVLEDGLGISVPTYGLMTRAGALLVPAAARLRDLILAQ